MSASTGGSSMGGGSVSAASAGSCLPPDVLRARLHALWAANTGAPQPGGDTVHQMNALRPAAPDVRAVLTGLYWYRIPPDALAAARGSVASWLAAQPWGAALTVTPLSPHSAPNAAACGAGTKRARPGRGAPPASYALWHTHGALPGWVGVPLAFGLSLWGMPTAPAADQRTHGLPMADAAVFVPAGEARLEQEMDVEAAAAMLRTWGRAVSLGDVALGKTRDALCVAFTHVRRKTLVVVPNETLLEQWISDIVGKSETWNDTAAPVTDAERAAAAAAATRCDHPGALLVKHLCAGCGAARYGYDCAACPAAAEESLVPPTCACGFVMCTATSGVRRRGHHDDAADAEDDDEDAHDDVDGGADDGMHAWITVGTSPARIGWAPAARVGRLQGALRPTVVAVDAEAAGVTARRRRRAPSAAGRVTPAAQDYKDKDIVLTTYQSLCQCAYPQAVLDEFGHAIVDEGTYLVAPGCAQLFQRLRFATMQTLTATPEVASGLEQSLYHLAGPVAFVYHRTPDITGRPSNVQVEHIRVPWEVPFLPRYPGSKDVHYTKTESALLALPERNAALLDVLRVLLESARGKVIVITKTRAHAKWLARACVTALGLAPQRVALLFGRKAGDDPEHIVAGTQPQQADAADVMETAAVPAAARAAATDARGKRVLTAKARWRIYAAAAKSQHTHVIVATAQALAKGFDDAGLRVMLVAAPVSGPGKLENGRTKNGSCQQLYGRLQRSADGSRLIVDFVDANGIFQGMSKARDRFAASRGFAVASVSWETFARRVQAVPADKRPAPWTALRA